MDSFVAPGVWLLLAGWFSLVKPSVIASRMLALACFVATTAVVHRCTLRLAGRGAAAGAVVALGVFAVWAFPAWTFSFYSPYAVLFALLALERLLAWRISRRRRDVILCGVALGLAMLFKQNYGVLASAGVLVGLLAIHGESRAPARARRCARRSPISLRSRAGVAVVGLPLLAWLLSVGALGAAFESLVLHPFGGFLGRHDIAYLPLSELFFKRKMADAGRLTYGAWAFSYTALRFDWPRPLVRGIELLHVLLYWLPPAFLAAGAALAFAARDARRRFDAGLLAAVCVAGCVFLGVFPRADFNHLVNVLQPPIGIAAVVSARALALAKRRRGVFAALTAGAAAALGIYAVVAAYWYVDLLRTLNAELTQPRGGVLVSKAEKQLLDFEISRIVQATRPGEPVLTIPAGSMLNFLAERPMPSRYYNLYAVHIAHDRGAGVVAGARAAGVRLVVTDSDDFFSERSKLREYAPLLVDFVRREFTIDYNLAVDQQIFLRRRETPLPERATLDVFERCDVGPGPRRGAQRARTPLVPQPASRAREGSAGRDPERRHALSRESSRGGDARAAGGLPTADAHRSRRGADRRDRRDRRAGAAARAASCCCMRRSRSGRRSAGAPRPGPSSASISRAGRTERWCSRSARCSGAGPR